MTSETNFLKILSLNGGGVRGLYTITVLAELERVLAEKHGRDDLSISEYFDMISGASIGGVIALALADGHRARDLEVEIKNLASKIFPQPRYFKNLIQNFKRAFGSLYNGDRLYNEIENILGKDRKIRHLKRRVLIPTVNLTTGKPLFVKTCHNPSFNRDDAFSLSDVARATSAAPTYFPPHYIKNVSAYFADGGLLANNPTFVAYHEAMNYLDDEFKGLEPAQIKIMNVGTLSSEYCIDPQRIKSKIPGYFKLWKLGSALVEVVMSSNQQMHTFMANRALNSSGDNIFELDGSVPDQQAHLITLDNSSEDALNILVARGKDTATTWSGKPEFMKMFFGEVAPEFIHPSDRGNK